jgi:hypothetical protein
MERKAEKYYRFCLLCLKANCCKRSLIFRLLGKSLNLRALSSKYGVAATLSYVSQDGDQNFPGTLTSKLTRTGSALDCAGATRLRGRHRPELPLLVWSPGRARGRSRHAAPRTTALRRAHRGDSR